MARYLTAFLRLIVPASLRDCGPHIPVTSREGWYSLCCISRERGFRRCLVALAMASTVPVSASAAPVRTMFADASQKELAVRAALADPAVSAAVLKSVRHTVTAYEAVVRRYPTSGYSDDALWQAARLSLDAFGRFGDVQDRETATRLLRWLAAEYPTSKLAKQVPGLLSASGRIAKAGGSPVAGGGASPRVASSTPAVSPSPVARPRTTSLTNIRRALLPDVVRVTIALDAEVAFHEERLAGPSRIFVDFPATQATRSLSDRTLRFDEDSDVVRHVRIGRQPNATTRVVLDATGISSYSIYPVYNPYRLVIDCVRAAPATPPRERAVASGVPLAPVGDKTKPGAAIDMARTTPDPRADAIQTTRGAAAGSAMVGPAAPVAPIRPVMPIASRGIVRTWTAPPPSATPNAAAILDAVRVPAVLTSRTVSNGWGRRLPNSSPAGTAAILDAMREPAALTSRTFTSAQIRGLPKGSPAATAAIADAFAAATAPVSAVSTVAAPAAQPLPSGSLVPSLGSGFSMARQLGLGVSRIVIDPGHGGHDPGAKGKGGITEAEVVLDVSLRLEKLLEKVPGVEVILTRHTDEFVPLPERTAIANREGADLFLSIHANASPNDQAHGVEAYFLNFANNLSAAAVAARENATSGQAMGALPDFVRAIALNNKLDESRDFATLVQQSMVERLRPINKTIKDLGVKQAPFVVLIGASMPSVLAEISFLTHEQEAKLLKNTAYRQRIAEALFDAVEQYQGSLKRIQRVAQQ